VFLMAEFEGRTLSFAREWIVGKRIGEGGFASVYEARSGDVDGAAKFIPKDPGAERELLFADDLRSAQNVVPVIDNGETEDHWVIVMPRANQSLRKWLIDHDAPVDLEDGLSVIQDVATALADLDGRVVHRDLKPENVLLLDGTWCISDFGISRYVEATTAPDTRKLALTYAYAAPERWRFARATSATDVYALGIMAFEIFAGARPFLGPTEDAYREQHLHENPPTLEGTPPLLAALIGECLYKAPEARPAPGNVLARLQSVRDTPSLAGLVRLQEANRSEVNRQAEVALQRSQAETDAERRGDLFQAAEANFGGIVAELAGMVDGAAPAASVGRGGVLAWSITLGAANLTLSRPKQTPSSPWKWQSPAFEVIAHSQLVLRAPSNNGYEGRSHSLWFCDATETGRFRWFETAFMFNPFSRQSIALEPFALDPGDSAAKAVGNGMNEFQVAWPFTPLEIGALGDFIDRWASWLAEAADGHLHHPSSMPERQPTEGTWRRT
jgi:serine/threonine protein kinase